VAERGHKNSRFRKFASIVAFRGIAVDRHLADDFEGALAMRGRTWRPRGAA
jgi:hypothetical protein